MNKKKKQPANLLERVPRRAEGLEWQIEEDGKITLLVKNTGLFNRIAQKLFKKPPVSYVHLDERGSAVWPLIDGEKTVFAIGEQLKAQLGDAAEPLYERLAQFLNILKSQTQVASSLLLWSSRPAV